MPEGPDPKELAAWNAWQRREMNRHLAWRRHRRAAATQRATGAQARAFNHLEAQLAALMDEWGIDYQWQFRLGRYVYDFLIPKHILLEIQGGYWHADPRLYAPDRLTPTQRRNVERDREKARWAECHGYHLKVIWEQDLRQGRVIRKTIQ
jgi:G:T-mismatch repair DNA endonuclease (very short patch repair protein)